MEPAATVVEAIAAKFNRAGEASPAAPELVEAARYKTKIQLAMVFLIQDAFIIRLMWFRSVGAGGGDSLGKTRKRGGRCVRT